MARVLFGKSRPGFLAAVVVLVLVLVLVVVVCVVAVAHGDMISVGRDGIGDRTDSG